ncbi:MAG: ABC transporter permease [Lachnospiraceae bacterium]
MNKGFYSKLAIQNIRKNGKFYFPYLLTFLVTVMMFYVMSAISFHPGIAKMHGGENIQQLLLFGTYTVGIFAVIFLFYTNSFLIRRRKKEFGLYNILGMEKRHIGRVLFWENLFVSAIGLVGGLVIGILLNKLLVMILVKLVHETAPIPFQIIPKAVIWTVVLFTAIAIVLFAASVCRLHLSNPIELLHSEHAGEREPKTKWVLAILGVAALAGGYGISWRTKDASAMFLFFVAVVLVIIGTYLLFTACSIVILKLLRKNKNFYYQTGHFTAVSGMLYRMKQNAVGLANICILSTMVLVTLSTTVSMYEGTQDAVKKLAPRDISIGINMETMAEKELEKAKTVAENVLEKSQKKYQLNSIRQFETLELVLKQGADQSYQYTNKFFGSDIYFMIVLKQSDYETLTGKKLSLKENGAALYVDKGESLEQKSNMVGTQIEVQKKLYSFPTDTNGNIYQNVSFLALEDQAYDELCQKCSEQKEYAPMNLRNYKLQFDVVGTKKEKSELKEQCQDYVGRNWSFIYSVYNYAEEYQEFRSATGSFLFLGVMLGVLFLMATVLIIYYKQISEGYEDKERFVIMQKVGMSKKEVRKTIQTQIRMVFFLPVLVAMVHVFAAFPIIKTLLKMCMLDNTKLFLLCIACTILIFFIAYTIVYRMTARVYYKIVES